LLSQFQSLPTDWNRAHWLNEQQVTALAEIGRIRSSTTDPRNVILYASAWLQKPGLPFTGISDEDVNALMSVVYGMDEVVPSVVEFEVAVPRLRPAGW
jgi:hypothetical protein